MKRMRFMVAVWVALLAFCGIAAAQFVQGRYVSDQLTLNGSQTAYDVLENVGDTGASPAIKRLVLLNLDDDKDCECRFEVNGDTTASSHWFPLLPTGEGKAPISFDSQGTIGPITGVYCRTTGCSGPGRDCGAVTLLAMVWW